MLTAAKIKHGLLREKLIFWLTYVVIILQLNLNVELVRGGLQEFEMGSGKTCSAKRQK